VTQLVVALSEGADIEGFRLGLRRGIGARIPPEEVVWQIDAEPGLFRDQAVAPASPISLPRDLADLIGDVVCHRDPERYALLYRLAWRVVSGERTLLEVHSDPLVHRLYLMAKSVRRDIHKMHAFLRFRRVPAELNERFVAWFEPEHYILEATADFFLRRYPSMHWSVITPDGSLHWDCAHLTVGPPGSPHDAGETGDVESAWDVYFQSTFNPARVNVEQMHREMPRKYWRNMPETKSIPDMLRAASSRVDQMIAAEPQPSIKRNPEKALATMLDPDINSLDELNAIIASSDPFVRGGARAVLGEGPRGAAIAFVGEQPGDQEDIQGRPFVGPAGQLFDRAIQEAGIDRRKCYVTNAVKHFKYGQRGKRRIHQKPTTGEVKHYRWWLLKEIELVRPQLVVALGGTAALALAGKSISVTRSRGPFDFGDQPGFITTHPSYLLRLPDEEARAQAYRSFVADLVDVQQRSA
jgi:probable DNA metabolism protein